MKKYKYLIISLILSSLGCKESNINSQILFIDSPKSPIFLDNMVSTNINGLGVPASTSIQVIDSLLIIFNSESDNVFEIYSTLTHEKVGGFGKKGRGPGEFGGLIELTGQINYDKNNHPVLYMHDINANKLYFIDIYACLNDLNHINESEVLPDYTKIAKVIYKDETSLYYMPMGYEARMMIYNYQKEEVKEVPYLPILDVPIRDNNKWMAYFSVYGVNNKLRKIVAAPILLGQVDYFDFDGIHVSSTNFDDFRKYRSDLNAENLTKTSLKQNIVEIKASEDFFYALNLDLSYTDIRADIIPSTSKILKFDWDGNLLNEYVLSHPSSSFSYDKLNNRLYIYNPYIKHTISYYNL